MRDLQEEKIMKELEEEAMGDLPDEILKTEFKEEAEAASEEASEVVSEMETGKKVVSEEVEEEVVLKSLLTKEGTTETDPEEEGNVEILEAEEIESCG